ncbi:MAG: hypothetical protein OXU36_11495 [Candidatus Poribacteria bacterium]|nr:hypothetical protein [Candidatus Poribacteria bacterium]
MKFLRVFFVLMFLLMSFTVFTDAVWHGPYYASADVSIHGNWIIGDAQARGTGVVRNGSYMCSIGMAVPSVSGNNINGSFSDGVGHMRLRTGQMMFADSSSWGSDNNGNHWHANDADFGR